MAFAQGVGGAAGRNPSSRRSIGLGLRWMWASRAAGVQGLARRLQLLRVGAARELLERGRAPVQNVASAVGYEDVASFRAIFKRHTGMTPADYRNRFGHLILERGALVQEADADA